MLYLDTSAVLPYYRQEARSGVVQELLLRQREPVLISDLTRLEFASALARWVRMGELSEPQAQRVERAFDDDVAAGRYTVRLLGPRAVERARRWLLQRTTPLRTLDALHLAGAAAVDAVFVTLDASLEEVAATLGVKTLSDWPSTRRTIRR
jgi:uncharacterized protein